MLGGAAIVRHVEALLLITNSAAGSADERSVDRALSVLRASSDVEVAVTTNFGELDGVLKRRSGRGVWSPVGTGACTPWWPRCTGATSSPTRWSAWSRSAPATTSPAAPGSRRREEAARVIVAGTVTPVDLIVDCFGEVVVNNVHIGAGARASHNAQPLKKLFGRFGYVLGGGEITPEADPRNGKMDVMVSYSTTLLAKLGYVIRFRRGSHHEREVVLYLRASKVTVSGQDFYCSADGELYGPERNRTWTLEPAAYSMPLP